VIQTKVPPARIAEGILRHDLWDMQRDILESVFTPGSRTAVKACHASSKTHTAADAVLIALLLGGDVLTTASSWEQVESVLWAQVRRAIADSIFPPGEWGQINLTELTMATGEKALGLSTNEYTRFQGFHARPESFLLVIVDEATGVRPEIYQAIEGIASGGDVRILLLGNPTEPSGPFYDVFANESPIWKRYTIDAFATPNLTGITLEDLLEMQESELDVNERAYLVTRRWVRERYYEWGVDHPEWQARVRGEFPQNADISLIWRSWIDDARSKEAHYAVDGGPLVAGIDVAGPGEDETVCYVRQGPNLLDAFATARREMYGDVLAFLRPFVHQGLTLVNIDSVGVGEGLYQHLKEHLEGIAINGVNVGKTNDVGLDKEHYVRLKDQLYWGLRLRFEGGEIAGITDPRLINQLASLRYKHLPNGKVETESKEDMIKRRGTSAEWSSPDRAEALMLCFAPALRGQRLAGAFQASAMRRR
jgi:phage terminase large subunit